MAELSSNRTCRNGVQDLTENERFAVVCSRPPENLEEIWPFHLVWPSALKACTKIYNTRAEPIVLWRSRCRRRSSFLNSLIIIWEQIVVVLDVYILHRQHREGVR